MVDYNPQTDSLLRFDFTAANRELTPEDIADTQRFDKWVKHKLNEGHYRYGIGGYMEHRTLYARSAHFDQGEEPRRLHLGTDIWAPAGTPVYAPLMGTIHSFKDNDNFGDYGPTIILHHNLDGLELYTLYGHLNRTSLEGLYPGKPIARGEQIAEFGDMEENGHWPPHLHFQLMFDLQGWQGDYPGVCRYSEMEHYRANVPNPELILRF